MPHPLLALFDVDLRTLPPLPFANKVISFTDALAVHPGFQDPLPPPLAGAAEIKAMATDYLGLANAVAAGNLTQKTARDALRPQVEVHTIMALQWAVMRSIRENNPSLIQNLVFDHKKPAAPRSHVHPLVAAPVNVVATHGPVSGTVFINTGKVKGATTYHVYGCQGDPSVEASWAEVGKSTGCRNIELRGLEPGKVYHFRVNCFGAAGHGPWSSIVSLMVI
jgi:hypothetical protein